MCFSSDWHGYVEMFPAHAFLQTLENGPPGGRKPKFRPAELFGGLVLCISLRKRKPACAPFEHEQSLDCLLSVYGQSEWSAVQALNL